MNFAIENYKTVEPKKQPNFGGVYWSKRSPKDSKININQNIFEQFDLIKVSDPKLFPTVFYKDGVKLNTTIEKNNE